MTRLYVGNLAREVTDAELEALFATAGTVVAVQVVLDRIHGRSRGFAFVEMATEAEAERALERFNGHVIGGRPMVVNEARPLSGNGGSPA